MKRHDDDISVNFGVVAGTVNGPVQNNAFSGGSTQVNGSSADASLVASAREHAEHLRRRLQVCAVAGDSVASLALDDLAHLKGWLDAPGYEMARLYHVLHRLTQRCGVVGAGPEMDAFHGAITALIGLREP